jgi:hypothetical protein
MTKLKNLTTIVFAASLSIISLVAEVSPLLGKVTSVSFALAAADPCNMPGKPAINYQPKGSDLNWRGGGKTHLEALDKAFASTGYKKEQFPIVKTALSVYGKTLPVEWSGGPDNAEVSMDCAHPGTVTKTGWNSGPDAPHVGWKVGKGTSRKKGHILIDMVPGGRTGKDGNPDE